MFRAFALAVGISLAILGGECLLIDKAVMAGSKSLAASTPASLELMQEQALPTGDIKTPKELVPPEWAPWVLLSVGAVIILYSFTIPRRVAGG
jgi:hypothetical protein